MLSSRTDAANLIEIDNILVEYGRVEIWLVMNALLCVWYFNPRIFTQARTLPKLKIAASNGDLCPAVVLTKRSELYLPIINFS